MVNVPGVGRLPGGPVTTVKKVNTADLVAKLFGAETVTREKQVTVGTGPTLLLDLNPRRIYYSYTNRSGDAGGTAHTAAVTTANSDYVPDKGGEQVLWSEDAMRVTRELWAVGAVSGIWYVEEELLL